MMRQVVSRFYDYIIALHDTTRKAAPILDQIEKTFSRLPEFSDYGIYPEGLPAIGIHKYCEIFFKPYQIIDKNIYLLMVSDDRRDMLSLLQRRLPNA
jgi:hypothetical protein